MCINTYAFWYCTYHDKGFLIKDNIGDNEVPNWCTTCNPCNETEQCKETDWNKRGVITYNSLDGNVIEVQEVLTSGYSNFNGGFSFIQYAKEYIDEFNMRIEISIYSPLYNWIKTKSQNKLVD